MSTFSILRKGSVDATCGLIISLLSVVDVALLRSLCRFCRAGETDGHGAANVRERFSRGIWLHALRYRVRLPKRGAVPADEDALWEFRVPAPDWARDDFGVG